MKKEEPVNLVKPKPYQEVGARFVISGWVPKSWLITSWGYLDNRIFLDLIDIKGIAFSCSSIDVRVPKGWLSRFRKKLYFSQIVEFNFFNAGFIKSSQGRIVVKLGGQDDVQSVYIPLIVKELEPEGGVDPEIVYRQAKIGDMIARYKLDLKNYNKEWEEIRKSRESKDNIYEDTDSNSYFYTQKWEIINGLLEILDESEDSYEGYLYANEDRRERELKEKYKDALEWRGPLLKGTVGSFNGFEFRVYSNDHGKHFHVIHKGKGINARFSYPKIELMSYKDSKNTIGSKEIFRIQMFFKDPKNLEKMEEEFNKRDQCQ